MSLVICCVHRQKDDVPQSSEYIGQSDHPIEPEHHDAVKSLIQTIHENTKLNIAAISLEAAKTTLVDVLLLIRYFGMTQNQGC